jgi:hypothetical protein
VQQRRCTNVRPPTHHPRAAAPLAAAFAALAVATASAVTPGAAHAAAGSGAILTAQDVPGLRAAGTGKRVALRALGQAPPRSLSRAAARGAAFARRGQRLSVGVFMLGSSAQAARSLRQAAHGFKRLPGVGNAAVKRTRTIRGKTQAVVLLRSGRAVGAVRLDLARRAPTRSATAAKAYAQALAAKLQRVLSQTAWQRTLDGVRPDGSISTALALRAFSIAYGPLPGVKRPTGRLGVPSSGTLAMQLVARRWASLTAAQKRAVDRALGAPHGPHANPTAHASDQILTPDAGYQAVANTFNAYYHARLPAAGTVAIKVFKASEEITDEKTNELVAADALALNASGEWGAGQPAYCQVRVPPTGQSYAGKPFFALIMAHEVFHCYEFSLMEDWRDRTDWIIEGMAEWAAVTAHPSPVAAAREWFETYLKTADAPLFSRTYSGIGFWARADEVGGTGSLWNKIPAILDAPDDPASYGLAGGTAQAFVSTWASATFRFPGAGPAWNQQSPFAISSKEIEPPADPVLDDATLASSPYSLRQYRVAMDVTRPLVHVVGSQGSLRVGTHLKDLGTVDSKWLCFGTCTCPSGEASHVPPHQKVSDPNVAIGLTGGADAGSGSVSFHALDEFCGRFTDLTVSGATNMGFTQPAFCVEPKGPGGGELRIEAAWNAKSVKQGHVTLTVAGYTGKGTYTIGPSAATVYDFRPASISHLWDVPVSGFITVRSIGVAFGFGASGTVSAVVRRDDPPSTVMVTGDWACTRNDSKP